MEGPSVAGRYLVLRWPVSAAAARRRRRGRRVRDGDRVGEGEGLRGIVGYIMGEHMVNCR
jgi:hypothetical protein